MGSVLDSDRVQSTLADLRALGSVEDPRYAEQIRAREAALGQPLYGSERAALGAGAPLAISEEVGQVLHALVLAVRPALIVEFGTSLGISAIYLASALAELGAGRLITAELLPEKVVRAQGVLTAAGLADRVEIRAGDALRTLADIEDEIDLLFLDGSNDLYLPLLGLLAPRLAPACVIAADMSAGDLHHDHYRAYVNDPANGLIASEVALGAGLVIATPRG